jgi:hypothetical protein
MKAACSSHPSLLTPPLRVIPRGTLGALDKIVVGHGGAAARAHIELTPPCAWRGASRQAEWGPSSLLLINARRSDSWWGLLVLGYRYRGIMELTGWSFTSV